VTLANPPENLRPGLSTTAKIKTAERKMSWLSYPSAGGANAQGFGRGGQECEETGQFKCDAGSAAASRAWAIRKKDEVQGVFVINGKKALFRAVETGIAGVTDIEITKGLQPGDEIVVGSYKALRTLKPESQVKVDNSAPKKQDDQQS